MPYYKVTYTRHNFTVEPAMRQSLDILFHSDYDGEFIMSGDKINPYYHLPDEIYPDLHAAYDEQIGEALSGEFPVEGWGGWSSLGIDTFVKVNDPLDYETIGEPVEGNPQIGEAFTYRGSSYRVTGFYREYISTREVDPMIQEIIDEERAKNPLPEGKKKIKLEPCFPHEATFVSGAGIAGCLANIKDIEVTGNVGWDDRTLAQRRIAYNRTHQRKIEKENYFPYLTEKLVDIDG